MARPRRHGPEHYRVEALARGLRLLAAFSPEEPQLELADVAQRAGLPVSTAFRMLATLQDEGYVESDYRGLYRPGISVLRLGFAALHALDIVSVTSPILRGLADETGETVNLGILVGCEVLYLSRLRNADLLTARVGVGSYLPAACTSMGKLLLALLPETQGARRISKSNLSLGRGPNAIRDIETFHRCLAAIKAAGWAIQDEELEYGLRSLAVPVIGHDGGAVAAINVAVSASRWPLVDAVNLLLPPAVRAGKSASERLGSLEEYPVSASAATEVWPFVITKKSP